MEEKWLGTDPKIRVNLQCTGFDMFDDNFSVDIRCGKNVKTYPKSNAAWVTDEDGNYYLCLNGEDLSGLVTMVATLYVPDEDFVGGIRKEVVKKDLFNLKKP